MLEFHCTETFKATYLSKQAAPGYVNKSSSLQIFMIKGAGAQ